MIFGGWCVRTQQTPPPPPPPDTPLLYFKKFNNNYFQGRPLGGCFWKLWKLNSVLEYKCFWNSKTYECQEHLFFRIPFTFHSLFFVNLLKPGGNKSCIKSCRCVYVYVCGLLVPPGIKRLFLSVLKTHLY